EINWDVWVPQSIEGGPDGTGELEPDPSLMRWERRPQLVSVACLGPHFENNSGPDEEHPHLLLTLGLDTLFLPELEDEAALAEALEGVAGNCYRENIAQLLTYLKKLEKSLPISRRLLWSSSGDDLAARIRSTYGV